LIVLAQEHAFSIRQPTKAQTLYIGITFCEEPDGHFQNVEEPEFSGATRWVERPQIDCTEEPPDGITRLELARLHLTPDGTEISDARDPKLPRPNEIDLTHVDYAGALGVARIRLDGEMQQRLDTVMVDARENMAALANRFPTPSIDDVRAAALQVRLLTDILEPGQLPQALAIVADLEQDVGEELGVGYPPLVAKPQYQAYQAALAALLALLARRASPSEVLTQQGVVNSAIRDLAEVVFPPPRADAGNDQVVRTLEATANVTLDATRSTAATDQRIVRYIWEEMES
jgi:hypothetical protein